MFVVFVPLNLCPNSCIMVIISITRYIIECIPIKVLQLVLLAPYLGLPHDHPHPLSSGSWQFAYNYNYKETLVARRWPTTIFAPLQVSSLHQQPVAIAFSLCLFGFFALPLIPACMELGVEVTYPVAEATSSGLLWSAVYVY